MRVNQVPEYNKEYGIVTLAPSNSVDDAIELFSQYNIGILPVVVEDNKIVGVFSERDVIRKVLGNELRIENTLITTTLISAAMTENPDTVSPESDVLDAIFSTIEGGYRHLLIADDSGKLLSVLSHRDLVEILWGELRGLDEDIKYTVGDLVELKDSDRLDTLTSKHLVVDAIDLLFEGNFGAVPVVDDGVLVGIITERDIIIRVMNDKLRYPHVPIGEAMTESPDTVTRDTPIRKIAESGVFRKYRHLLIVDEVDSELKSILSLRDFVEIPYKILMSKLSGSPVLPEQNVAL